MRNKAARFVVRFVRDSAVISVFVTIAATPLTMLRFHVVAPIGVLLNLPLIPITSAAILAAGLALGLSVVWAPLAWPFERFCELMVRLTEVVSLWGARQSWGYRFDPGPKPIYVAVFYVLLVLAVWLWRTGSKRRTFYLGWSILGTWTILGVVATVRPQPPKALEAEVLSVGHGLCVLIRDEAGRVIVYDCGRMRDPGVGKRIIAPALWSHGVRTIDSVILSHADADHFNGLPDLLDRFAIGRVLVPAGFGGSTNPDATKLLETIASEGVPVRDIHKGDAIPLAQDASLEILHPPEGWPAFAADNVRSVTARLQARGQTFLLTGDLEGLGLSLVMEQPIGEVDVLLSPHHGGRKSNTRALFDWAKPKQIVVSQRAPAPNVFDALADPSSRGIPVLRTWELGALTCSWREGGIVAEGYLVRREPNVRSRLETLLMFEPFWQTMITVVGSILGIGLCLGLMVVEWGGWSLVAPRRRGGGLQLDPFPEGWTRVEVKADDKTTLSGLHRRPHDAPVGLVVFVHGFAEDGRVMLPVAEKIVQSGFHVLVVDQRGHGASGGDRVSFGGRETGDLLTWLDWASAHQKDIVRTIVWGRSMGAAAALRAADQDARISALVLEAPYLDLLSAVSGWLRRMRIPAFLAPLVLWKAGKLAQAPMRRPRPIEIASKINIPVLIAHGSDDPVVPLAEAQRLGSAFPERAIVIDVPGAEHVDVLQVGGAWAIDRIRDFLLSVAATAEPSSASSPSLTKAGVSDAM